MEKVKITGIIFAAKPYKEFDRLVTLFSAERGIIAILAKGVRRARSRRSYHLDLLSEVAMELEENVGKSRLPYLREISTVRAFFMLKKNPGAFAAACTAASFLLRTLPAGSIQSEIYALTQKMFGALDSSDKPAALLLPYFLKIIRLLGYLPHRLPKNALKENLSRALRNLDPQFMLQARRTLEALPSPNGPTPYFEARNTTSDAPILPGRA